MSLPVCWRLISRVAILQAIGRGLHPFGLWQLGGLELGEADPHLHVPRAVQQALVQRPRRRPLPLVDLEVYVRLRRQPRAALSVRAVCTG